MQDKINPLALSLKFVTTRLENEPLLVRHHTSSQCSNRGVWLTQQCAVALTLPVVLPVDPVAGGGNSKSAGVANPAAAHTAFADTLSTIPGGGVAELELSSAVDLVRAHGVRKYGCHVPLAMLAWMFRVSLLGSPGDVDCSWLCL